ncbi:MAG: histidinol-phosphate transaminase [Candidatus Bathyarchaeota archaeon]|nr:histidinol-phosphate transaminase [Candidatus Bathyarchaeota archaeon]
MNVQGKAWLDRKLEELRGFEIYSAEKTNQEIADQYGLQVSDIVKLNYNENLYTPREKVVALLKEVADEVDFRIYPQQEETKLKAEISRYLKVTPDAIVIRNSSDEVMEHVIRTFLDKNSTAVTFTPTFSVFKYCVNYHGSKFVGVPLREDFSMDMQAMKEAFSADVKLLYLCSPNNPTANQLGQEELEELIQDFPGIVLIDEAYGEYADYSMVPLTSKYENLVVLRTFSKAFSLAGLRLGYAVANPELARALDKSPAPYPVSVVSLSMGVKVLQNIDIMQTSVAALKQEREKLIRSLSEIEGIRAFDSKANFVLFETDKPYLEAYERVLRQGLVIKKLGKLLSYENCLRTTVGLPAMNAKLLMALREYMGEKA